MSKNTKIISASVHNRIVSVLSTTYASYETGGSLVTQVCDVANSALRGAEIPSVERKLIVADVAEARGWKDQALKARSSEVNVILKAYATLGEAVRLFTKKNSGRCQWHDTMKLARRINAGDSTAQAVAAAFMKSEAKAGNPAGRVAGALKAWYKASKGEKRAKILKACELLGIERVGE